MHELRYRSCIVLQRKQDFCMFPSGKVKVGTSCSRDQLTRTKIVKQGVILDMMHLSEEKIAQHPLTHSFGRTVRTS